MKLEYSLFVIVIGLCCIVAVLFVVPPGPDAAGSAHSRIAAMNEGGDGSRRHEGWQLVVGWVFGLLQIAFFVGVALFAVRDRQGSKSLLLLAGLAFVMCFAMMLSSYVLYLRNPLTSFVMSFPPPTAWMVFGLWSVPVLFTVLYVFKFRDWIFSEEDQRRFERLLSERAEAESGE